MAHLLQLRDLVDVVIQGRISETQVRVTDDTAPHLSLSNPQGLDVGSDESQIKTNVSPIGTFDNAVFEVGGVNTNKGAATTAGTSSDTDIQKLLNSCEELSRQVRQYMPTTSPHSVPHPPAKSQILSHSSEGRDMLSTSPMHDRMVSLRELFYLHRREFKIQGGQIGDQGSDINYNNICRQIDEGLKEQFSGAEIVRAVLRVIKPGNFKDMLMNKDDLTVEELKAFLHSHLGEQSNMELFQELMCTKQKDNETPQQFLYRVIGLKQKILLASKHANTDVKYSANTVQDIFLHSVYQGLGHKHDDVRRELKPLLADTNITD